MLSGEVTRIGQYVVATVPYAITGERTLCRVVKLLPTSNEGPRMLVQVIDTYDKAVRFFIGKEYDVPVSTFEKTTKKGWMLIKAVHG